MSSVLIISPYAPSQPASVKRGRGRPGKASPAKEKKKSPKKLVSAAHVNSYPTVNLVDEFTDTVRFGDPVLEHEDEPPLQLGEFLLLSPKEDAQSDPLGFTSSDKVDPLSTNSDCINSDPGDNCLRSSDLGSFFLFERRSEPSVKIPLNSDGDKVVADMLRNVMIDVCSNQIGEMEIRKKNDWITNWRKLRYIRSDLLKTTAPEGSGRSVLDYNYCDDKTPIPLAPATVAYETYRKKSLTEAPNLTPAKGGYNTRHSVTELEHVPANNDRHLIDGQQSVESTMIDGGGTTDLRVPEHHVDQTCRSSVSNLRSVGVDAGHRSPLDSSASYPKTAGASRTRPKRQGNARQPTKKESSVPESLRKGRQSQISNTAASRNDSHCAESSCVEKTSIAIPQDTSLLQKTSTPSGTDALHATGHITSQSGEQKSCESKKLRKRRRPRTKKKSAKQNRAFPVEPSSYVEISNISVPQSSSLPGFPAASEPVVLELDLAKNILYSKPSDIDQCDSSVNKSTAEQPNEFSSIENANQESQGCFRRDPKVQSQDLSHPVAVCTPEDGANTNDLPHAEIQGETPQNRQCANCTTRVSCRFGDGVDSKDSCPMVSKSPTGPSILKSSSCPWETSHGTWGHPGTPQVPLSTDCATARRCSCIHSQATNSPYATSRHHCHNHVSSSSSGVQNEVFQGFACSCYQLKPNENAVGHSSKSAEGLPCHGSRICVPTPNDFKPGAYQVSDQCACCSKSSYKIKNEEAIRLNYINRSTNIPVYVCQNPCVKSELCQNCTASHQMHGIPNFEKPCTRRFPVVCSGAPRPMVRQDCTACECQTFCCEAKQASFNPMSNCQNHPLPMMLSARQHRRHSAGRSFHCSQPSFFAQGSTAEFVACDPSSSCDSGFLSHSHQARPNSMTPLPADIVPQNLGAMSNYGAASELAQPPACTSKRECGNESSSDCNGRAAFNPHYMHLPSFPDTSAVLSSSCVPGCCRRASSNPACSITPHLPGDSQAICPPVTSQVCQSGQYSFSGKCTSCSPPSFVVKCETAKVSPGQPTNEIGQPRQSTNSANKFGEAERSTNTLGQHFKFLDAVVISSSDDDDQIEQNFDTTFRYNVPRRVSHPPPKNSSSNNAVGQPGQPANTVALPGLSADPAGQSGQSIIPARQCFNENVDSVVISSDDEQTDENFDAAFKSKVPRCHPASHPPPQNSVWSAKVVSHPGQSANRGERPGQSANRVGRPVLLTNRIGQPRRSVIIIKKQQSRIKNFSQLLNKSMDLVEISSDDEQIDKNSDAASSNKVPRCISHLPPQNSVGSYTVGQPGRSANTIGQPEQPAATIGKPGRMNNSKSLTKNPDSIVISSDDEQTDQNFDAALTNKVPRCISHLPRQNCVGSYTFGQPGLSANTIGQPEQSTNTIGLPGPSVDTIGQPERMINTIRERPTENLDSIVISSDDDQTDQNFGSPSHTVWMVM